MGKTFSNWSKNLWKFGFVISELVVGFDEQNNYNRNTPSESISTHCGLQFRPIVGSMRITAFDDSWNGTACL